jgi:hypothetical protein
MSRVVKAGRPARMWTVGGALALVLVACAAPSGGGGTAATTASTATTTAPTPTTTVAPTTTAVPTTSTTVPATTTTAPTPTTTAPPSSPTDPAFGQGVSVSSEGFDSSQPHVAIDRQGDALLAWVRETHDYPYQRQVEVRSWSHAGTWGPIVPLSPPGQAPHAPKVALDDDGDAVVVWDAFDGTDYRVYARRVSSTGTLGTLQVLSGTGVQIHGTEVAVDSDGDAVVTWAEWQSDGSVIPKMRRFTRGGSLPAEAVLSSSPARAEAPAVAFDREGDAVLAWANDYVVQARALTASGTLGELETVSADLSPIDRHFTARVTVDRDGDALVTWRHWTDADQSTQVWGRWVARDGTVGAVRQLTPSSHPDVQNYSVAGDLDGDVLLTWDRFPSGEMYARQVTSAATLPQPVLLTSYGRLHTVRVDDDGDGVVVWQGEGIDGSVGSVRARRVTRTGAFGAPQVVAPTGVFPTLAVGPTGGAMILWERRFQVDLRIQASVAP